MFKSTNGGTSWDPANNGLTHFQVANLVVHPVSPTVVYAGTLGGGVFRSTNRGQAWSAFNPGLTNDDVRALAISPSGTCLHAGTFGAGVFDLATRFDDPCAALSPPVSAAVLPSARSVGVNTPATAFATILNPNDTVARSCGISLLTEEDATFAYQTTDPTTNQVVGTPNTPVDIPAGGSQTYVIGVTPTDSFNDVELWEAVRPSVWRHHRAGEDLIREDTADEHLYIVATGLMKVTRRGKLLNAVSPGECVGEMAYARRDGRPRSATVTAVEPSWALRLRVQDIDSLSEPCRARFTEAFLAIMAERLSMLGGRLIA